MASATPTVWRVKQGSGDEVLGIGVPVRRERVDGIPELFAERSLSTALAS
jgi:hypothetical protein